MLETTDDATLLVTESIVHDTSYTTATIREIHRCPSISWESSSARRWLNGDFIDKMDEWSAQRILSKKNTTYDSAFIKKARSFDDSYLKRHTEYEPQITIDRAFCLDPFEATKYFHLRLRSTSGMLQIEFATERETPRIGACAHTAGKLTAMCTELMSGAILVVEDILL